LLPPFSNHVIKYLQHSRIVNYKYFITWLENGGSN
jgi:hypothetical protein